VDTCQRPDGACVPLIFIWRFHTKKTPAALMYAGKLRAMATLGDIPGIEVVVRDRVEQQRKSHGEVSAELQPLYPGVRGLSCMSVRRYCSQHGIHRTSRVDDATLDRIVTLNVAKVNADNQRTVTTELVLTYGICLPTLLKKRESEVHIFQ